VPPILTPSSSALPCALGLGECVPFRRCPTLSPPIQIVRSIFRVVGISVICRPNSQMSALLANISLLWRHKTEPGNYFVSFLIAMRHFTHVLRRGKRLTVLPISPCQKFDKGLRKAKIH
jgi:hypothetical protein